jgi:hypothetical protein
VLFGVTLLLALPRMAGVRGGRLLKIGAVLSAIGFSSIGFIVYAHGETYRFMAQTLSPGSVEPSVYGPLFERFEQAIPLAAFPSLLGRLGLLLAVIGLVRARTVPLWAAVGLLSPVVFMGTGGGLPIALALGLFFVPLLVGIVYIARHVARTGGPALG